MKRPRLISDIPTKANRILNLILFAFMLIILRVWHLSVMQHEEREENAMQPQRRTFVETAKRGTIRDRFNIPLAVNRLQYNASILYAPIKEIPMIRWEIKSDGTRIKHFKRREYIQELSKLLGDKLSINSQRVEDLIHAKGALYNQLPLVIKEDITEKEYYSLKILEKDWPGIHMQRVSKRYYPQGKVASDIVGYLGAINKEEYDKIIEEMGALQSFLAAMQLDEELPLPEPFANIEEVRLRLKELKAKSYTLNDRVGKTGVEARFENDLRGYNGKKYFRCNAKGNLLNPLSGGYDAISGRRLILTISSELQEFAEKLLIQNENIRETRATTLKDNQKRFLAKRKPWIKGGAVVVLDPNSGDVLALATHPRYDPNDFLFSGQDDELNSRKQSNIMRWLELEGHIAEIWDGKSGLKREYYDEKAQLILEEEKQMTWEAYLQILFPPGNPVLSILKDATLRGALEMISFGDECLEAFTQEDHHLCVDLCRVAIDEERFSEDLLKEVGNVSIGKYRDHTAAYLCIQDVVKRMVKELYHDNHFVPWRVENEKPFLASKRLEEKAQKRYAKPYIDLLDAEEARQFNEFWNQNRWELLNAFLWGKKSESDESSLSESRLKGYEEHFLLWHSEIAQGAHQKIPWQKSYLKLKNGLESISPHLRALYLQTMRAFKELNRPLQGKYSSLRNYRKGQTEKDLAAAFYPRFGYGYGRSQAYRQAAPQGSIFKLVTAYEALIQRFQELKDCVALTSFQLNPLEINDLFSSNGKETIVGYMADGKPIPRFYKGGRMPKSLKNRLGKMGIQKAIETSSNPYFSLLAGDILKSPNDLNEAAKKFSYGEKTGIDLPCEIPGKLPRDLETNRTGLYAMAIGQHSLVVTPLQAAVMLATIANEGTVYKPNIVKMLMTPVSGDISGGKSQKNLPTFTIERFKPLEKQRIPMPASVRSILLEGMYGMVQRSQNESLSALSYLYKNYPEAISDYIDLKEELLGKTSTAEIIERTDLDSKNGVHMYNHVWFGGISYKEKSHRTVCIANDRFGSPELVVVVYLRFGGFGKEGAPIAAQLVAKWREIQEKMSKIRDQESSTTTNDHL